MEGKNQTHSDFLRAQHRVGSVHLRPFYDRNERAFHREDIPPWAKKAKEDILRRKSELLNPSKTPEWNPETNPNHKCERYSSRILEVSDESTMPAKPEAV
eukprot:gb/GECG01011659.1/.p1 GENE.gb/GECG01011659.1/~~gb/GECG01011659.1/.p1  ORF type:complete len:100 (+),score=14.65 gb/GECG01011659.1/:1-300(+)